MKTKKLIVILILLFAILSMNMPVMAAQGDLGREVLPPNVAGLRLALARQADLRRWIPRCMLLPIAQS